MSNALSELQKKIKYTFRDCTLLETARTHSSYANEAGRGLVCNERLEFLGDAVLSIIVSDYLFHKYDLPEGDLTRLRASLICEKTLFLFSKQISLGQSLLLGRGEERSGGRDRPSVCSDAFEAVIAAIYLDGGIDSARDFVLPFIEQVLEEHATPFRDYKTRLQEIVQQNPEERLSYVQVDESGPDHDKRFEVEVRLNSNVIGTGGGRSKKAAEQQAAKKALELMGIFD